MTSTSTSPSLSGTDDATASLAVHPNNGYAYVLDHKAKTLKAYPLASSGQAAPTPKFTVQLNGSEPVALTVHPKGEFVYVATRTDLRQIPLHRDGAAQGGAVPTITWENTKPGGIAVSPGGEYLHVTAPSKGTVFSYTLDTSKSNGRPKSFTIKDTSPYAVTTLKSRTYIADPERNMLYSFRTEKDGTFVADAKPMQFTISGPTGLAVHPTGQCLYVVGDKARAHYVPLNADGDFADGAKATPFSGIKHKIRDLAVSSDGKYVYAITRSTDGSQGLLLTKTTKTGGPSEDW